jgi:hypothetical protein
MRQFKTRNDPEELNLLRLCCENSNLALWDNIQKRRGSEFTARRHGAPKRSRVCTQGPGARFVYVTVPTALEYCLLFCVGLKFGLSH